MIIGGFVENELQRHDPLKHIAVQILKFSISYETTPTKVKNIIREGLKRNSDHMAQCAKFAKDNGYENLDLLLEISEFECTFHLY